MTTDKEQEAFGLVLERHKSSASENDIRAAFQRFMETASIAAPAGWTSTSTTPASSSRRTSCGTDYYFAGRQKQFRVRYDKIVAFEPFSDGFGIMRDAPTAKPQTFWTGDGWFAYNLAVNLAQLQA